MTLVDTSIWVDHLRALDETLVSLLTIGQVLAHPFVVGELALGTPHKRDVILKSLQRLPMANVASDHEVLHFS